MREAFPSILVILITLAAAIPSLAADTNDLANGLEFQVRLSPREDAVDREYREVLALDDSATEDVERWLAEADAQASGVDEAALQSRIDQRMAAVEEAYRKFLGAHPDHVHGRIAFGSFLAETDREMEAREHWEKARDLDPKNPAVYNNLAGSYGHRGPVTNAFVCYEKAIELAPDEPVYYQNFATTVFLFRRDVMEHYAITNEQRVFDKALELYGKAQELDPNNFILATDVAQTYYGIRPPRHDAALAAWRRALALASDSLEQQGIHLHLARTQVMAGRFYDAQVHLNLVTNAEYARTKGLILKTLERRLSDQTSTAPAGAGAPAPAPSRQPEPHGP